MFKQWIDQNWDYRKLQRQKGRGLSMYMNSLDASFLCWWSPFHNIQPPWWQSYHCNSLSSWGRVLQVIPLFMFLSGFLEVRKRHDHFSVLKESASEGKASGNRLGLFLRILVVDWLWPAKPSLGLPLTPHKSPWGGEWEKQMSGNCWVKIDSLISRTQMSLQAKQDK